MQEFRKWLAGRSVLDSTECSRSGPGVSAAPFAAPVTVGVGMLGGGLHGRRAALRARSRPRGNALRIEAIGVIHGPSPGCFGEGWGQNGRRVFLTDEIRSYPNLVKAIAGKQGAKVQKVAVTGKPSPRWLRSY